jgi:imidazolonepropionase-like amidohydrolase
MEDQYGTLAVGKVANLVVWDGDDPFELSCWAQEVWIRGRKIDMTSRQTQLRDRYMDLDAFAD